MAKEWVSDKIGESYKEWKNGDIITITAGTGVGKSHFIKNDLYKWAKSQDKKILFLIHRTNCVEQFKSEILKECKDDIITIKTYQSLEWSSKNKKIVDLENYDYIVSDEFQYYISDASFNFTTDLSLDLILEQNNKVRIFMSATPEEINAYFKNVKKINTRDYNVPISYDFIETLTFFNKEETLEDFMREAIENNQKAIFFFDKAMDAYELHRKFPDETMFNCSSNNSLYKYVDKNKVKSMLDNERFDDLVLITTKAMDAGVNIKDEELKHIVADIKDVGTLIQCIGRKRIMNNEKIHLHIRNISNKRLSGIRLQASDRIEKASYLKREGLEKYLEKYPREVDDSGIIYAEGIENQGEFCTLKVNELMLFKVENDINMYEEWKSLSQNGYIEYICRLFNKKNRIIYEESDKRKRLLKILESLVGKKLWKNGNEQEYLIQAINFRFNGEQYRSATKLNIGLSQENIPFQIVTLEDNTRKLEDGTDNPNRGKVYWTLFPILDMED